MSKYLKSLVLFLSVLLSFSFAFASQPVSGCASNDQRCLSYQKALDNYQKLKYLEEKQLWDDYFTNGNTYRDQIVENSKKVIESTGNTNPLRVKSRLLLWQFHRGQQDAFSQQALEDLMTDLRAYAKEANDPGLLKDAADELMNYEEKPAGREVYKLYVDKLVLAQTDKLQLKNIAAGFYKGQNLELAQTVYDLYIEEISKALKPDKPQEFAIRELFEIASMFVYKPTGLYDMAYAEKIYAKIDALSQKDEFNQETIYLRAFNLEKLGEYKDASKFYLQLIKLYPDSKYFDEIVYKQGIINAYALANIAQARKYFDILAAKAVFSPQVISSFYQLGLLAQWEGDLEKARSFYDLLLKNAADKDFTSLTSLAKQRLSEIQENRQLEYNLKTFMDLSLKNDFVLSETGKSELKVSNYVLNKDQKFSVSSFVNMPQSGCNQVELQYLWSGDLGGAAPAAGEANFSGAYSDRGTKLINMVVILPAGALDRSFTMVDVY